MNFKNLKAKLVVAALAASPMLASAAVDDETFKGFYTTVKGWTQGALGMGLATTMLLMGGAIGVAKNSPMPALSGIAGAAFLHWGPGIIENMMTVQGALI